MSDFDLYSVLVSEGERVESERKFMCERVCEGWGVIWKFKYRDGWKIRKLKFWDVWKIQLGTGLENSNLFQFSLPSVTLNFPYPTCHLIFRLLEPSS